MPLCALADDVKALGIRALDDDLVRPSGIRDVVHQPARLQRRESYMEIGAVGTIGAATKREVSRRLELKIPIERGECTIADHDWHMHAPPALRESSGIAWRQFVDESKSAIAIEVGYTTIRGYVARPDARRWVQQFHWRAHGHRLA